MDDERLAAAWDALHSVYDPCSLVTGDPIDLVDLGVVRDVRISPDGEVVVVISPTSPGCMVVPIISSQVVDAVSEALCDGAVEVEVDREFLWTSEAMAPEARARKSEREQRMVEELGILPARERKRLALGNTSSVA